MEIILIILLFRNWRRN